MTLSFLPNEADATYTDQAEPDSVDFDILLDGYGQTGVLSGCAVTESGTPAQTVDVASGSVLIDGVSVTVTAQTGVAVSAADATNPRIDVISINTSGTAVVTAGTAAAQPVAPAVPASSVALAFLYVPANDNTHNNAQINDKRVMLVSRQSVYMLAASDAPQWWKDNANETLDGVDDDVQIQAANDTYKYLLLSPGTFDIGTPISLNTGSLIKGSGWNTVLQANGITTGDRAVIVSKNNTAKGATVADLHIDGNYAAGGPCHGINMRNTGLDAGDPDASSDNVFTFRNLLIEGCRSGSGTTYSGIYLQSASADMRSNFIESCYISNCGHSGIRLSGSSDNFIIGVHIGSINGDGILVAGANNHIFSSKVFYANAAGVNVTSSRTIINGLSVQDNGTHGLIINGADCIAEGVQADSNGRLGTGSGIKIINGAGSKVSFLATNGSSGTQEYGIEFSSNPTACHVEGTVTADMNTAAVLGTPGKESHVRIVRENDTPYIAGGGQVAEVSTATTLDWTHGVVNVDTSAGAVTITLPDNATYKGKNFLIHRDGASSVTINRAGTDTFDDAATSKTLGSDGAGIGFFSIGDGEWKIVGTQGTVT